MNADDFPFGKIISRDEILHSNNNLSKDKLFTQAVVFELYPCVSNFQQKQYFVYFETVLGLGKISLKGQAFVDLSRLVRILRELKEINERNLYLYADPLYNHEIGVDIGQSEIRVIILKHADEFPFKFIDLQAHLDLFQSLITQLQKLPPV